MFYNVFFQECFGLRQSAHFTIFKTSLNFHGLKNSGILLGLDKTFHTGRMFAVGGCLGDQWFRNTKFSPALFKAIPSTVTWRNDDNAENQGKWRILKSSMVKNKWVLRATMTLV